MVSVNIIFAFFLALVATVAAAPGYSGGHSKHVVIHVPYHVHTVHHHHVKKIHVPVEIPVIKKVYIHEEPHHHGGWW